jgi:hypothetical protein
MTRSKGKVTLKCGVCGTAVTKRVSRIEWEQRRNPDYVPICDSPICRGKTISKGWKKKIAETPSEPQKPKSIPKPKEQKPRSEKDLMRDGWVRSPRKFEGNHKGYVAREKHYKRIKLVNEGKASWFMPLFSVDKAIELAGL